MQGKYDILWYPVERLEYSHTSLSLRFIEVLAGPQGGSPNQTPLLLSHDGFKSLFLPGWFMCIHAPGSLSFVCLLIRHRPGTYCRPRCLAALVWSPCWFFGDRSAGWETVGRMGWLVPSSPRSDRSDTHTLDPLSLTARSILAFLRLWHLFFPAWVPAARGAFPPPFSWLRAGLSNFLAPSGHARDPEFHALLLGPCGKFWCGVRRHGGIGSISGLAGGACSHCNCVFLLPDWVLPFPGGFLLWRGACVVAFRLR